METNFPHIFEAIKVDKDLHVQLQYEGTPLPLPQWFTHGHNAKLTKYSMLENFPPYIQGVISEKADQYTLLDELCKRKLFKPKGQPPYSPQMIRYALLLRYTSVQAYKFLQEKIPFPSLSLLQKLQKGGVDSIRAASVLREKGIFFITI